MSSKMNDTHIKESTHHGKEIYYIEDVSHRFVCQNGTLNNDGATLQIGMLVCGYHPGFDSNIAISKSQTTKEKDAYQLCLTSRLVPDIDYLQQAKHAIQRGHSLRSQWQYINNGLELLVPNTGKSNEISHAIMTSLKLAVAMHFSTTECLLEVADRSHLFDLYLEKIYQPRRNIHDISSHFFDLAMQIH